MTSLLLALVSAGCEGVPVPGAPVLPVACETVTLSGTQARREDGVVVEGRTTRSSLIAFGNVLRGSELVNATVHVTLEGDGQLIAPGRQTGDAHSLTGVRTFPLWVAPASWAQRGRAWAEKPLQAQVLDERVKRLKPAVERWVGPLPDPLLVVVPDESPTHLGRAWPGVITIDLSVAPEDADAVTAHELCHQVWGRSVLRETGAPPWEAEALCQAVGALAVESLEGRAKADEVRERLWTKVWQAYRSRGGAVGAADALRFPTEAALVAHVYARAPWFYEGVRSAVGDDAFAKALIAYAEAHPFKESCGGCLVQFLTQRFPEQRERIEALEREHVQASAPEPKLKTAPYVVEPKPSRCACESTPGGLLALALALLLRR